jgi:hypothetical protein
VYCEAGYLGKSLLPKKLCESLKNLVLNGVPITGTLIGTGPDTCWGRINSFSYRADVTSLVAGNGSYSITGVANGGAILAEGASLVVIYQSPSLPSKNIVLVDGDVALNTSGASSTAFIDGIHPHRDIVMSLPAVHLVGSDPDHRRRAHLFRCIHGAAVYRIPG